MSKKGRHTHPLFYIEKSEWCSGGLFELETTYYYEIICKETGEIVLEFSSDYSAELDGDGMWGSSSLIGSYDIQFSEDGKYLLVFETGSKKPKKFKLPECD